MRQFTQEGRITSLHGFFLPPKKKLEIKKYVTLRFCIPGTIPSKKNMIWAASNIMDLVTALTMCKTLAETKECITAKFKAYVKNSGRYNEWMKEMRPLIQDQLQIELSRYKASYNIIVPLDLVSVKIYHYWKDDLERDLDNKQSTIYDLLKNCSVISNDNWQCLYKIHSECENYIGQITQALTTVDVTYMIP